MRVRSIREVLAERTVEWMAIPGVVGTAVGESEGRPCIKILVVEMTVELAAKFPTDVEEYRVVVEETGQFRAL